MVTAVAKKTAIIAEDPTAVDDLSKPLGGDTAGLTDSSDSNNEIDERLPPNFSFSARQAGWKSEQPTERYQAVLVENPNSSSKMWVLFGTNITTHHSTLHEYETTSYKWCARKMTGTIPTTTFSHNYRLYEGYLYLWGGHGKRGFVGELFRMNCKTLEWQPLDVRGTPPNYISSASCGAGNKMFCFGGKSPTGKLSADVHVLDLDTLVWSVLDVGTDPFYDDTQQCIHRNSRKQHWFARPIARHSTSLDCIDDVLFMFGGHDTVGSQIPSNEIESPNTVFKLSLDNPRWVAVSCLGDPPPMKIYGHRTFSLKGVLMCVGGFKSPHVHVFDVAKSVWTAPSSIESSCREEKESPLKLNETAQILTPAQGGKHKGEIWAGCRITRLRADGLYDVHVSPTPGSQYSGAMTGVGRSRLRRLSVSLFPPRCHPVALPISSSNRFIVFGGIQIENNKILQDTHLISVVTPHE